MIAVYFSKCTGCRTCECVCAFYHSGRINNNIARIRVLNQNGTGINSPVVCSQCPERFCMKCPENALSIGHYGEIIVSRTLCNQCGVCEKNCPTGAVELFNDIAYVCDLCGGFPKCIDACPEDALTWKRGDTERLSLKEIKALTKRMNPSQKRHTFLHHQKANDKNPSGASHD